MAAEMLIKVSNKIFRAQLPQNMTIDNVSGGNQIIDLLKNSDIREVVMPEKNNETLKGGTWTEPKANRGTWTEPKASVGKCIDVKDKLGTWTEPK